MVKKSRIDYQTFSPFYNRGLLLPNPPDYGPEALPVLAAIGVMSSERNNKTVAIDYFGSFVHNEKHGLFTKMPSYYFHGIEVKYPTSVEYRKQIFPDTVEEQTELIVRAARSGNGVFVVIHASRLHTESVHAPNDVMTVSIIGVDEGR